MCSNPCEIHRPSRRLWDGRDSGINRLLLRTLCIVLAIAGEFGHYSNSVPKANTPLLRPF